MIKVIVAGSREFDNYILLKRKLDYYLQNHTSKQIIIISGGAKGADKLGEKYAKENNIRLRVVEADWDRLGKQAGYLRNVEMAEYATHCIVFWDGKSKGSKHMIDIAGKYKLRTVVINF